MVWVSACQKGLRSGACETVVSHHLSVRFIRFFQIVSSPPSSCVPTPPSPPPHPNPPPRPHPAPRAHLGQASTACACCTPFGSSCSGDGTRRARLRLRLLRRACGRAASRRRHGRRPLRLPRYVSSGRRMRFRRSPLQLRRKPRRLRTCPERMRAVGAATSTTGSTTTKP